MSVFLTTTNLLRIVKILEVKQENLTSKTFTFNDKLCSKARPGQFVMIWIPRVDEIPMSLSTIGPKDLASITVADVGEATRTLHQRKQGDTIGIRGPYGNGFKLTEGKTMIVGGGTGVAPLVPLAEKLVKTSSKITFLIGAEKKNKLLFLGRLERMLTKTNAEIIATTEDGSHGRKGMVTTLAKQKLEKTKFDIIYTCGPEKMMYRMFILAERHKTPIQASLERIMRCAIGLCGSCVVGKFRVCKDGPVLNSQQLEESRDEFGRFTRDLQGRKTQI